MNFDISNFKTSKLLKVNVESAYAKKAFDGPQQVLEYIGRYTHKICISNFRIKNITDHEVSFD